MISARLDAIKRQCRARLRKSGTPRNSMARSEADQRRQGAKMRLINTQMRRALLQKPICVGATFVLSQRPVEGKNLACQTASETRSTDRRSFLTHSGLWKRDGFNNTIRVEDTETIADLAWLEANVMLQQHDPSRGY